MKCEVCAAELERRTLVVIYAPHASLVCCRRCRAELAAKLPTTRNGKLVWWASLWGRS